MWIAAAVDQRALTPGTRACYVMHSCNGETGPSMWWSSRPSSPGAATARASASPSADQHHHRISQLHKERL